MLSGSFPKHLIQIQTSDFRDDSTAQYNGENIGSWMITMLYNTIKPSTTLYRTCVQRVELKVEVIHR